MHLRSSSKRTTWFTKRLTRLHCWKLPPLYRVKQSLTPTARNTTMSSILKPVRKCEFQVAQKQDSLQDFTCATSFASVNANAHHTNILSSAKFFRSKFTPPSLRSVSIKKRRCWNIKSKQLEKIPRHAKSTTPSPVNPKRSIPRYICIVRWCFAFTVGEVAIPIAANYNNDDSSILRYGWVQL